MLADRMRMSTGGWKSFDVQDATVVNQAYDTSGNGGRKLVRLSNGWLVATAKDSITDVNKPVYKLFVSSDNGETWVEDSYSIGAFAGVYDVSLVNKGNTLYLLSSSKTGSNIWRSRHHYKNFDTGVTGYSEIETSTQTDMKNVSLAINEQGTELHATWSSKNSAYPNSFNIRYAKGTINAGGSVTWGSLSQIKTLNTSGQNFKNPTVVVRGDGNPVVVCEFASSSTNTISAYYWDGYSWSSGTNIYIGGSYIQSSPSAIFVPSEINGLPNGRIWVAWHGTDSTNSKPKIKVSYSDDGGVTWVAPNVFESGVNYSFYYPSISSYANGDIFIISESDFKGAGYKVVMQKYNGSWSSTLIITSGVESTKPSSLADYKIEATSPLFIYKTASKVGFYGTWKSK